MGYSTRSGEYTRSRYFATLAHRNPCVMGCAGSPWILVARPSSTVISVPQASGQSCGHAACMTFFITQRLPQLSHAVVFLASQLGMSTKCKHRRDEPPENWAGTQVFRLTL